MGESRHQVEWSIVVADIPRAVSLEDAERIRINCQSVINKAILAELRLARARLADYLVKYRAWINANPDAAAAHNGVQSVLIRGELIHQQIGQLESGAARRLGIPRTSCRERIVESLTGLRKD